MVQERQQILRGTERGVRTAQRLYVRTTGGREVLRTGGGEGVPVREAVDRAHHVQLRSGGSRRIDYWSGGYAVRLVQELDDALPGEPVGVQQAGIPARRFRPAPVGDGRHGSDRRDSGGSGLLRNRPL